jgi:ABC-type antimicrobial peptide transport system permease subunit
MDNSRARETIVGIVADTRYYSLRTAAAPIVYLPINGNTAFTLYVRSALLVGQVMRIVEREADRIGSGMQIHEITTLEAIVGNTLLRERLLAGIGGAFAFVGLLLAAIGLFGLLNYSVGRRTKEIGIRVALGARRAQIFALVLKDITALTGAGMVAGLGGTLAILAIVKSLLFGIKTADPFVTVAAIGVLIATGFLAASLPAYRAATVDPTHALREE